MHSVKLCKPPPAGPLVMLWPWPLTFDLLFPNINVFVLVPKCINAESLVKFSPVIFKISTDQGQKCIFQHVERTATLNFDPKTWSVHLCPITYQCWKFGINMSNTFQDTVLSTMFRRHRRTGSQAAWIHNASGHYVGGGIKRPNVIRDQLLPQKLNYHINNTLWLVPWCKTEEKNCKKENECQLSFITMKIRQHRVQRYSMIHLNIIFN